MARRRFDPAAGERWTAYVAWSGLSQLREVVSLDEMLCPTVPEQLLAADWEYKVHADYQTTCFHSLDYLRERVGGETGISLLAILQNPSADDVERVVLPGFVLRGYDIVDVEGGVSALTNCGGFNDVFANAELSPVGLLPELGRAYEVQGALRAGYPHERHARCHVWAIWREET